MLVLESTKAYMRTPPTQPTLACRPAWSLASREAHSKVNESVGGSAGFLVGAQRMKTELPATRVGGRHVLYGASPAAGRTTKAGGERESRESRRAMPKSNFLRKKNKTGATADFKRLKAKVRPVNQSHTSPRPTDHAVPFTYPQRDQ